MNMTKEEKYAVAKNALEGFFNSTKEEKESVCRDALSAVDYLWKDDSEVEVYDSHRDWCDVFCAKAKGTVKTEYGNLLRNIKGDKDDPYRDSYNWIDDQVIVKVEDVEGIVRDVLAKFNLKPEETLYGEIDRFNITAPDVSFHKQIGVRADFYNENGKRRYFHIMLHVRYEKTEEKHFEVEIYSCADK